MMRALYIMLLMLSGSVWAEDQIVVLHKTRRVMAPPPAGFTDTFKSNWITAFFCQDTNPVDPVAVNSSTGTGMDANIDLGLISQPTHVPPLGDTNVFVYLFDAIDDRMDNTNLNTSSFGMFKNANDFMLSCWLRIDADNDAVQTIWRVTPGNESQIFLRFDWRNTGTPDHILIQGLEHPGGGANNRWSYETDANFLDSWEFGEWVFVSLIKEEGLAPQLFVSGTNTPLTVTGGNDLTFGLDDFPVYTNANYFVRLGGAGYRSVLQDLIPPVFYITNTLPIETHPVTGNEIQP